MFLSGLQLKRFKQKFPTHFPSTHFQQTVSKQLYDLQILLYFSIFVKIKAQSGIVTHTMHNVICSSWCLLKRCIADICKNTFNETQCQQFDSERQNNSKLTCLRVFARARKIKLNILQFIFTSHANTEKSQIKDVFLLFQATKHA